MSQPDGKLPELNLSAHAESVPLVGQALAVATELIDLIPGADNYTDVVYRGLALMKQAVGKQVELREPGSRTTLVVDLWA